MLTRERALEALAGEQFDIVVIGGGITGAGVALDAASRGYSVALVEQADFASGTSSRSSKLVHGGLRYLQNFDLGLVREALLERQLMVRLAPHLVRPLQLVVPAFDGARPDRLTGIGLNMYDVMAAPSLRARRSARRSAPENGDADWSPARHRVISGEEVSDAAAGAGRARADRRLSVLRLPDRRRPPGADRARGGRAVRRHLRQPAAGDSSCGSSEDLAAGVTVRDRESGAEFVVRADNVVNATGVWADRIRPEELYSEAEVPRIAPSRGTHITLSPDDLPLRAGAIVPAGGGRSIFALPWLGRSLIGTTDNNYDGDIDHVQPSRDDVDYLLEAVNEFFGAEPVARQPDRRLRRRAPADLQRRQPQVGRHLAQGRAVRDLERADHDHRRQAHHLAPDGQAGRRPAGGARRPPGAVPDPGDPAGRTGGPGRL